MASETASHGIGEGDGGHRLVPMLDLRAEFEEHRDEIVAALVRVLEGMELHLGPETAAFEREFAAYVGVRNAVGVGSGTEALWLCYHCLGIGQGDEVIVPSHTFIATVAPLHFLGATPVFVDIDPATYNLDPELVAQAITSRTRAIVPVHLYGHPADMTRLRQLAAGAGVALIEDCAQAAGSIYQGQHVGSMGSAGAFSFVFTKNLKAYGDAGLVTTNDDALAAEMRRVRDHGRSQKYEHPVFGLNLRLDEMQAAILRVQLRFHEARTMQRRRNALRLSTALANSGLALPTERRACRHAYHQYVVGTPRRAEMQAWLGARGVSSAVHYPIPCHLQAAVSSGGVTVPALPNTVKAANEVLSLPVYPELAEAQLDHVIESVLTFTREHR